MENEDKKTIILKMRKRQLITLGHIMRKKALKNAIFTGDIEGTEENNAWPKQRACVNE